jgi:hypothetical protein
LRSSPHPHLAPHLAAAPTPRSTHSRDDLAAANNFAHQPRAIASRQPRANLAPTSRINQGMIHLMLAASPLPRPSSPLPSPCRAPLLAASPLPRPSSPLRSPYLAPLLAASPLPRPSSPLPSPSPRILSPASPLQTSPRAVPRKPKTLAAIHSSFLAPLAVGSDGSSPATQLLECCKGSCIFYFEFPSISNPNRICRHSWPEWGTLTWLKIKKNVTLPRL